jgi:hypothetical protein
VIGRRRGLTLTDEEPKQDAGVAFRFVGGFERLGQGVRRLPPIAADAALALAIFAVGVIELTWFSSPEAPPIHVSGWSFAIFALMSLALVARRANVWIAASVITAGVVVATFAHLDIGGKSEQILATVLVFSVADRAPTPVALISVVAAVGLWWWLGDVLSQDSGFPLYLVLLGATSRGPPNKCSSWPFTQSPPTGIGGGRSPPW